MLLPSLFHHIINRDNAHLPESELKFSQHANSATSRTTRILAPLGAAIAAAVFLF